MRTVVEMKPYEPLLSVRSGRQPAAARAVALSLSTLLSAGALLFLMAGLARAAEPFDDIEVTVGLRRVKFAAAINRDFRVRGSTVRFSIFNEDGSTAAVTPAKRISLRRVRYVWRINLRLLTPGLKTAVATYVSPAGEAISSMPEEFDVALPVRPAPQSAPGTSTVPGVQPPRPLLKDCTLHAEHGMISVIPNRPSVPGAIISFTLHPDRDPSTLPARAALVLERRTILEVETNRLVPAWPIVLMWLGPWSPRYPAVISTAPRGVTARGRGRMDPTKTYRITINVATSRTERYQYTVTLPPQGQPNPRPDPGCSDGGGNPDDPPNPTAPTITGIRPATGYAADSQPGTVVTLTGTLLTGVAVVRVGAVPAAPRILDDNTLTFEIPTGAELGPAEVCITKAGFEDVCRAGLLTVLARPEQPPAVTVIPHVGPQAAVSFLSDIRATCENRSAVGFRVQFRVPTQGLQSHMNSATVYFRVVGENPLTGNPDCDPSRQLGCVRQEARLNGSSGTQDYVAEILGLSSNSNYYVAVFVDKEYVDPITGQRRRVVIAGPEPVPVNDFAALKTILARRTTPPPPLCWPGPGTLDDRGHKTRFFVSDLRLMRESVLALQGSLPAGNPAQLSRALDLGLIHRQLTLDSQKYFAMSPGDLRAVSQYLDVLGESDPFNNRTDGPRPFLGLLLKEGVDTDGVPYQDKWVSVGFVSRLHQVMGFEAGVKKLVKVGDDSDVVRIRHFVTRVKPCPTFLTCREGFSFQVLREVIPPVQDTFPEALAKMAVAARATYDDWRDTDGEVIDPTRVAIGPMSYALDTFSNLDQIRFGYKLASDPSPSFKLGVLGVNFGPQDEAQYVDGGSDPYPVIFGKFYDKSDNPQRIFGFSDAAGRTLFPFDLSFTSREFFPVGGRATEKDAAEITTVLQNLGIMEYETLSVTPAGPVRTTDYGGGVHSDEQELLCMVRSNWNNFQTVANIMSILLTRRLVVWHDPNSEQSFTQVDYPAVEVRQHVFPGSTSEPFYKKVAAAGIAAATGTDTRYLDIYRHTGSDSSLPDGTRVVTVNADVLLTDPRNTNPNRRMHFTVVLHHKTYQLMGGGGSDHVADKMTVSVDRLEPPPA